MLGWVPLLKAANFVCDLLLGVAYRASLRILLGPAFAVALMHAGRAVAGAPQAAAEGLLFRSTEDFQVAWYDLMSFHINSFFHLKALDKPKSQPSKSQRCS